MKDNSPFIIFKSINVNVDLQEHLKSIFIVLSICLKFFKVDQLHTHSHTHTLYIYILLNNIFLLTDLYGSNIENKSIFVSFISLTVSIDSFVWVTYRMLQKKDVHMYKLKKSNVFYVHFT